MTCARSVSVSSSRVARGTRSSSTDKALASPRHIYVANWFFGSFILTITNLDTGQSVKVNSSGSGTLSSSGLPVIGRGPWVIFEPIAQGGLRFFHGVTRFVPAPYGVHAIPISGREENLCERVA